MRPCREAAPQVVRMPGSPRRLPIAPGLRRARRRGAWAIHVPTAGSRSKHDGAHERPDQAVQDEAADARSESPDRDLDAAAQQQRQDRVAERGEQAQMVNRTTVAVPASVATT
jgi:hypothetical protein